MKAIRPVALLLEAFDCVWLDRCVEAIDFFQYGEKLLAPQMVTKSQSEYIGEY